MRISAIQPNYINRISFRQDGINVIDKPIDEKRSNMMDKNTKTAVTAGVGVLAVVGLVYAGYKGKLGAKIQKFLGGADNAAKNIERELSDLSGNDAKSVGKVDNIDINSNSSTDMGENLKIIKEEEPKKVFDASDAEDVEFVEDIHKFLTPEEFKSLPEEELIKRASADLEEIAKANEDVEEYSNAVENYFKNYGIDNIDVVEEPKKYASIWDIALDKTEAKFRDQLLANGGLNEFILGRARVKFLIGEHENAEKLIMGVINNAGMSADKLESYATLKCIADVSENPEKYFQILNKELEKDFKTVNELQIAARKHVENFGRRKEDICDKDSAIYKFLNSKVYFESLDSLFDNIFESKQNVPIRETIKSIIEANKEIETFISGKAAN